MDNFIGFTCPSCDELQPKPLRNPFKEIYLSGSVCRHCGQVISSQTKREQLDDYIRLHGVLPDPVIEQPQPLKKPYAAVH